MDIEYLLILQKLRELSGGVLDSLMMRTTALGEQIITFLALSFIYWCVDKRAGRLMAFNVSVACTWNQYTKWKCRVERPWVRDARIEPFREPGAIPFPADTPAGRRPCGGL